MLVGVIISFLGAHQGSRERRTQMVSLSPSPAPLVSLSPSPAPDGNLCPTIITCHVSNVSPAPPHVSKYPDCLPTICNYEYMGYRVRNNLIACIPEKGYGKEFSKLVFSLFYQNATRCVKKQYSKYSVIVVC